MADRTVAAPAQISEALVQIAVGEDQNEGEDLNEAEDHCELALSVVEAVRVARVRTVAAPAHNSEGLPGDSVTLISEAPAFQSFRVFGVALPVDPHALHCGAVGWEWRDRFSARLDRAGQFSLACQGSPTAQRSPLAQRYRGLKVAQEHLVSVHQPRARSRRGFLENHVVD